MQPVGSLCQLLAALIRNTVNSIRNGGRQNALGGFYDSVVDCCYSGGDLYSRQLLTDEMVLLLQHLPTASARFLSR